MKKTLLLIVAAMMVASCGSKSPTMEKEMNTLSFNQEQAAFMSAIACNEAKADYTALAETINDGLDAGLTVSQIKEALSQLYAYTGFPRSLNALGTLQKVLQQRNVEGKATELSGRPFNYDFCPAEDYYLKAHLFGDIFARDNLTHADRELITVSALSGLENVMPQLQAHVRGALNMGVTEEQLRNIPVALKAAGLQAEALRCEAAIAAAVEGKNDVLCAQSPWPIGEPNTAYAQYFIGNSYLAVLDPATGLCNVSFEPGCRNNWHIHHGAVQMLICVSGRGWYQEWGREAVPLVPGTVIAVPEGVKHWHGAVKDSWMQHLTYHANAQPGNSNEWLEPVSDEQYDMLK